MNNTSSQFVFFGTSEFSIIVLETLRGRGLLPKAIVTTPDRPQGRKLVTAAPPVKIWAQENGVAVLQFEKLNDDAISTLSNLKVDFFIVASYGKIIPQAILDIPTKGALNIHPSLLPLYRGASPLQSTILADDSDTGVTIIKMDALMDHGPIVAARKVKIADWPPTVTELEHTLAISGTQLLADHLDEYINNTLTPIEQDHHKATFTKKISREEGLINIKDESDANARISFLKFQAFQGWPGTYFFTERKGKKIRVTIKDAKFEEGKFIITKVTPEGGKEISYEEFLRGL
ncbi:MAG: methionyl-tRNA formyltransferase [Patescibacteria group bacterium]